MPARRWAIPLEGDPHGDLFFEEGGRLIASTARLVEAIAPGGLAHITKIVEGRTPATTYVNAHAHRCYAIDPDGAVAWTAEGVYGKCAAPGGRLIATNDRNEMLVLDRDGAERERRPMGAERWSVSGWQGAEPIRSTAVGARWVDPFAYALFDHHLHRYDAAGNLLARTAIPRRPFEVELRRRPDLANLPKPVLFPECFDLEYHAPRRRLIASHWSVLAWTMSLQLDGGVDWVSLVGDACCNSICFAGESVTVHTSSCGSRVSFLSADGAVFRAHEVDGALHAVPDGRVGGGVCVLTSDAIRAFDERGEPGWTIELPGLRAAIARAGTLYAVAGEAGRSELIAFDLG